MLRAFRAFDGFRGGDIKAWLLAIVRNCWLSAGLATSVPAYAAPAWRTGTAGGKEADPGRRPTRPVSGMDGQLDCLARTGVQGSAWSSGKPEDLSYREIADITGAPIGTVMSRLYRKRRARNCGKVRRIALSYDDHPAKRRLSRRPADEPRRPMPPKPPAQAGNVAICHCRSSKSQRRFCARMLCSIWRAGLAARPHPRGADP